VIRGCACDFLFNLHISTNALMMSFLPGVDVVAPFLRLELPKFDDPFVRFLFAIITGVFGFGFGSRFLWSDVAERSVVVLLVPMVCLQRFLTQSLISEPNNDTIGSCYPSPCNPRISPMYGLMKQGKCIERNRYVLCCKVYPTHVRRHRPPQCRQRLCSTHYGVAEVTVCVWNARSCHGSDTV
jgi:hypothetical protein